MDYVIEMLNIPVQTAIITTVFNIPFTGIIINNSKINLLKNYIAFVVWSVEALLNKPKEISKPQINTK